MPSWRFYDNAAGVPQGIIEAWDGSNLSALWLRDTYVFDQTIPYMELREWSGYQGETVTSDYPESKNPMQNLPLVPDDWPDVELRGLPADQAFELPGQYFDENGEQLGRNYSMLGESVLYFDTLNNKLLWHCPHVYWVAPEVPITDIMHLIFAQGRVHGVPIALLSWEAPWTPTPGVRYELRWSGGLQGVVEDRYGIPFQLVES